MMPMEFQPHLQESTFIKEYSQSIATVIHFGAQPTTSWKEQSFSSLSQGLVASMDETEAIRAVFYTALKLAMSDSNSMPHSHKSSETKIKEFALTMLCNNYDNYSLDPSAAFDTHQGRVRPSEETIREFCETIHFLGAHNTLINWQNVLKGSRGASN
jgi:hypothetical protein